MPFLTQGKTNWKFIGIVAVLAVIVGGGIWFLGSLELEKPVIPEEEITEEIEDKTADWQIYRNEEYGFEIKYPNNWSYSVRPDGPLFLGDGATFLTFINRFDGVSPPFPSPPWCVTSEFFKFSDKNGFERKIYSTFQEGVDEDECDQFLLDEHLVYGQFCIDKESRVYSPEVKETVFGYTFTCNGGTLYNIMLLCEGENWQGGVGKNECIALFNQILSTFRLIEVTAESLPEEIRNNKDFISWIKEWQMVKPAYAVESFTKIAEDRFSLNGKPINQEELEDAMEAIQSPYLPEERRKLYYSPDRTKFIWNAGFPDPLDVDQDVVLFNFSTNKYQHLKTCGTACWFEKIFWIDNSHFVVIRMGEYPYSEREFGYDYSHSIFFYDLEKNVASEYHSSEVISWEEKQEFRKE